jgi:uncharacterized RDD family membrane protein YckC
MLNAARAEDIISESQATGEKTMQWADDLRIETPEQIEVELELAGLGSRFVARLLDWAIKWGLLLFGAVLVFILVALFKVDYGRQAVVILLAALFTGFLVAYDVYFEVRANGQTPGKRRAGIRVVRESGAPIDFRSSCIRNVLGIADFLPGFYMLGGFLVLLTPRHQRLGDMAAGTIVVRERALEAPPDLTGSIDRLASQEFTFTAEQLKPCFPDGRHILRSFFQRYEELDRPARHQLATRLANEFVRKTGYPLSKPLAGGARAEAFLASLYRDIESLNQHGR